MRRLAFALALAFASFGVAAGELRPFGADSLAAIKTQFAGRPFILALWSIDCTHCVKELRLLGRLVRTERGLPLVIVSTDTPEGAPAIHAALKRFGLGRLDTWVFDDAVPERLRHAIDPAWRGELPRAYFFDAAHRREAHSGLLDEARLKDWLRRSRPEH